MPDMTVAQALLLFVAGLGAGFVNAVAGGGSAITLPILTELLDASIANGTNRVAILIANITASASYGKGGAVPWKAVRPLIIPAVIGSAAGAWAASLVSPDAMKRVFSVVLILVAASVALRPARWV
ncbi:MAG: sulfite exporter TauE/SafE family protein, partial [Acidimicrobiia bacterium]|nr:sulfite exporter TauE/SafE family protein [Acidimicrobiia bacterium]